MVKALLIIARSFRRMAVALEHIESLYRLELNAQGIYETRAGLKDDVEVTYGVRVTDPDNLDDDDISR